jgi:hypothetical protein
MRASTKMTRGNSYSECWSMLNLRSAVAEELEYANVHTIKLFDYGFMKYDATILATGRSSHKTIEVVMQSTSKGKVTLTG